MVRDGLARQGHIIASTVTNLWAVVHSGFAARNPGKSSRSIHCVVVPDSLLQPCRVLPTHSPTLWQSRQTRPGPGGGSDPLTAGTERGAPTAFRVAPVSFSV